MNSAMCSRCKVRLTVVGSNLCQVCAEKASLERQVTLDQARLEVGE